MSDELVRELELVGDRGDVRGAAAVYAGARDDADLALVDLDVVRRGRRRRGPLVLRAAMVVLVVALALVFAVSRQVSPGRPLAPADLLPSRVLDPRRQQVDVWLDEYDPAEIQNLYDTKDEGYGEISDESLLSFLEYRRTCRFVQRAIDAGAAAPDDERAATVAAILEPQIARYVERLGTEGNTDEGWVKLMGRIQAGDGATAQSYIDHNCTYAFGPWVDD